MIVYSNVTAKQLITQSDAANAGNYTRVARVEEWNSFDKENILSAIIDGEILSFGEDASSLRHFLYKQGQITPVEEYTQIKDWNDMTDIALVLNNTLEDWAASNLKRGQQLIEDTMGGWFFRTFYLK